MLLTSTSINIDPKPQNVNITFSQFTSSTSLGTSYTLSIIKSRTTHSPFLHLMHHYNLYYQHESQYKYHTLFMGDTIWDFDLAHSCIHDLAWKRGFILTHMAHIIFSS